MHIHKKDLKYFLYSIILISRRDSNGTAVVSNDFQAQVVSPVSEHRHHRRQFKTFTPLVEEIRVDLKIVPATRTTCKRGEEYCVLLYSERTILLRNAHLFNCAAM